MIKGDKKRKTRSGSKTQSTVPAFLLKTYEILEVNTHISSFAKYFRIQRTMTLFPGIKRETRSLSSASTIFPKKYFQSISSITTSPLSSDR